MIAMITPNNTTHFYTDAVKVGLLGKNNHWEGGQLKVANPMQDYPWLTQSPLQTHDVERFIWFADRWAAQDPNDPLTMIDARYSLLPSSTQALWSITLNPNALGNHVTFNKQHKINNADFGIFWAMIWE